MTAIMNKPIWSLSEIEDALDPTLIDCDCDGFYGVSIDTRTLQDTDIFVAIKGEHLDGHDYVPQALENGAGLCIIAQNQLDSLRDQLDALHDKKLNKRLCVVDDPLDALYELARFARARTKAQIVAVTGSVGKTGTKDMLRHVLGHFGKTHAAVASFNNHWGVPLTLARMAQDCEFGVIEIGMNHVGEITPLVQLARPHTAIITTVEPVHLEFFSGIEEIAMAKAEIFKGIEPGGAAILNADNDQFDLLKHYAETEKVSRIVTFGEVENASICLKNHKLHHDHSVVEVELESADALYKLGVPGRHIIQNSLAVIAVIEEFGVDLAKALLSLQDLKASSGRGNCIEFNLDGSKLIVLDESYNANPASMKAAIASLALWSDDQINRRIAVLGDMLELGEDAPQLHALLLDTLLNSSVDRVFLAGPMMENLWQKLPQDMCGAHSLTSDELAPIVCKQLHPGDLVIIKGSLGSKMKNVLDMVRKRFG